MAMDFLTNYKPTETDLHFARWVVSHIKDGGLWAIPITGDAFRIYHNPAARGGGRLVCVEESPDDELFARTKAVFGAIGYQVFLRGESRAAGDSAARP
jgi:hypothetical protein